MQCPKCGHENHNQAKFCGVCGNKMLTNTPTNAMPIKQTKAKPKWVIPVIIGGAVAFVLAVICVILLIVNSQDSHDDFDDDFGVPSVSINDTVIPIEPFEPNHDGSAVDGSVLNPPTIYLEATQDELNNLDMFIGGIVARAGAQSSSFDSESITYTDFINRFLLYTSGDSYLYNSYFFAEERDYSSRPDPYNRFYPEDYEWKCGRYYVFPKQYIDWIMTNIFNMPQSTILGFSESEITDDDTYFYANSIYQEIHVGFGDSGYYIVVDSYERLSDGRYKVSFTEMDGFAEVVNCRGTAIVSMQNIDGSRYWTIHSISV